MASKTPAVRAATESTAGQNDRGCSTWIPLDPATDRGEHGLTPLLLHRLGHNFGATGVTLAQMLAQRLVEAALDGHFPSLEQILVRIDGNAKSSEPATSSTKIKHQIDDLTAQRILDAYQE